jgi:hypothetical protein
MYYERHQAWPSRATLHPIMLWDLARLLDLEDFQALTSRMAIATSAEMGLIVAGDGGELDYGRHEHNVERLSIQQAIDWLGLRYGMESREHD